MGSVAWIAVLGTMTALVVSGAGVAFTAQPLMERVSDARGEIRQAVGEARATVDDARQDAEDDVEETRETAKDCTPQLTQARAMKADPDALVDYLNDRIEEAEEESVPEECDAGTIHWV